ncbi:hypothetical protein V6N12_060864 [Hibiscus sabdariffa]|uniref:Uncharacterized protein n=1 Tax=Hibiscus sabdariffa TaxID=183260 RepID=A0ABR2D6K2_9ROSI
MGGNSGGERGVLKSPTYAINSPLIDACIPVVLGKSTMDHSESSNAGRPINISTKSINPPPGFIIGPISIQPIPIMDVDMGPVDEEKLLIQSEGLKRPRMNITTNGSLVHSNPPSFDNVVSVETHSEISAYHCPLLVTTIPILFPTRVWHFRFEASWLLEESSEVEVLRSWPMSNGSVPEKLKQVGLGLDGWFRGLRKAKKKTTNGLRERLAQLCDLTPTDEDLLLTDLGLNRTLIVNSFIPTEASAVLKIPLPESNISDKQGAPTTTSFREMESSMVETQEDEPETKPSGQQPTK